MGEFLIEQFYLFFQGILLFQVFFFGMIYSITLRKEILFYCLFILLQLCYFFLNAPKTFFNIEENTIFNSNWYLNFNYLLILCSNLFYLLFLKSIFTKDDKNDLALNKLIKYTIWILPILFCFFLIFPIFSLSRSFIFYLANMLTYPASFFIIYKNHHRKEGFQSLIIKGIVCNILGTLLTVIMIARYNKGIRTYPIDDYPLLYMRIGILADVFFYQLAILRKWYDQEKLLATKDIQNKLDISDIKNQISRELHDDVGTTLSKINLQSFMAQQKMVDASYDINTTLHSIQLESQDLIKRIKNLIWSVDEITGNFNLLDKLHAYVSSMCDSKNINYEITNAINQLEDIHIKIKYNLLMICREAINNSVKYSKANSIKINFKKDGDNLLLNIKDDGIGFDQNHKSDGLGLMNMTQRVNKLEGEILISSNNGVQIQVCIPLS